jgi:hypothetical protein
LTCTCTYLEASCVKLLNARGTTVTVGARRGDYAGKVDARTYRFTVHGGTAPARVLLDGRPLPRSSWSFDPATRVTTVTTARLPLDDGFSVRLRGGR